MLAGIELQKISTEDRSSLAMHLPLLRIETKKNWNKLNVLLSATCWSVTYQPRLKTLSVSSRWSPLIKRHLRDPLRFMIKLIDCFNLKLIAKIEIRSPGRWQSTGRVDYSLEQITRTTSNLKRIPNEFRTNSDGFETISDDFIQLLTGFIAAMTATKPSAHQSLWKSVAMNYHALAVDWLIFVYKLQLNQ